MGEKTTYDPRSGLRQFFGGKPDILVVILYGSFARHGAGPKSDVDVGIYPQNPMDPLTLATMATDLGQALGREVDLVDLREAHGAILEEVIVRGEHLIVRDPEVMARLLKRMWYEKEDDARFRQITWQERLRQWDK